MRVVVPFAVERPKTRLGDVLDPSERRAFARAMLQDVLEAVVATGHSVEVLATAPVEFEDSNPESVGITVDERALTPAVNAVLSAAGSESVAVVMADLALATPAALSKLFSKRAGVVLAPGRGGGTNALVARDPDFRVAYHGASYRDHRRIAGESGASVATVDSYRLGTDIDQRADLAEVLLHTTGAAREWLDAAGVSLRVADGRVGVRRDGSE